MAARKPTEAEERAWKKLEEEISQPGYYDNITQEQKDAWIAQMEKEEDEEADWIETVKPDPKICTCMDCEWREPDRRYGNSTEVDKGALLNLCQIYGTAKPQDVLWEGAECPYYLKEITPKPIKTF